MAWVLSCAVLILEGHAELEVKRCVTSIDFEWGIINPSFSVGCLKLKIRIFTMEIPGKTVFILRQDPGACYLCFYNYCLVMLLATARWQWHRKRQDMIRFLLQSNLDIRLLLLANVWYRSADATPFLLMGHGRVVKTLATTVVAEGCF